MADRWLLGIILGFAAVFTANGLIIYVSTQTPDAVEPSYTAEAR